MGLRYRVPLPGPFYYSGRVGPEHWAPRGSSTSSGPGVFYIAMKWLVVYPSLVFFGAGLAIVVAPFYGVFWVVRRLLRNRRKCQLAGQCFPVRRPGLQRPAVRPVSVSGSYGFVPDRRPVQPFPYGFVPAHRPVPAMAHVPPRGAAGR